MDTDNELARAKWLIFSGVFFLVSCYICYGELVYFLQGKQIQARVIRTYELTRRGRFGLSRGKVLTVEYAFSEPDGTPRTDDDTVNPNWELPSDGTVFVQYTPGADGRSRLSGHVNWFAIGFFVLSIVVLIVFGYRLWREAYEATRPSKPKRGRMSSY